MDATNQKAVDIIRHQLTHVQMAYDVMSAVYAEALTVASNEVGGGLSMLEDAIQELERALEYAEAEAADR